jgi:hypothetical protein
MPDMRRLPIVLPSRLIIAEIVVPVPMTERDFEWIQARLSEMGPALTKGSANESVLDAGPDAA